MATARMLCSITYFSLDMANCHLYNYGNNNPIVYTDPDGKSAENGLPDTAVFRLEDPIPANQIPLYDSVTGKALLDANGKQMYYDKEIDTVILKAGGFCYGDFDGAMDTNGNFYKVTARSPWTSVSFKIEDGAIKFAGGFEKLKNNGGDFYKNHITKGGDLTSGYYLSGSDEANYLLDEWGSQIFNDIGKPELWDSEYNSNTQYSLRKYLKEMYYLDMKRRENLMMIKPLGNIYHAW